jgi:hypothetical protein
MSPAVSAEKRPASSNDPVPGPTISEADRHRAPRRRKRRIDPSERVESGRDSDIKETAGQFVVPRHSHWGMAIGQVCAYFGIGLITCGTAAVLWGYFGGPSNYAPTGWLVTTIGQMFLFLGVVTLISHGMEQTSSEVATRIERLGERMIRIEDLHRRHVATGPHRRKKRRRPEADDSRAVGMEEA